MKHAENTPTNHWQCLSYLLQDMLIKRAADIAEALYSVPRPHSQLQALPSSPAHGSVMGLGSYPSQLGVGIGEHGQSSQGEWELTTNPPKVSLCWRRSCPGLRWSGFIFFHFPSRLHQEFQQLVPERLPIGIHPTAVQLRGQRWDDRGLWDGTHDQSGSSWFPRLQQRLAHKHPLQ